MRLHRFLIFMTSAAACAVLLVVDVRQAQVPGFPGNSGVALPPPGSLSATRCAHELAAKNPEHPNTRPAAAGLEWTLWRKLPWIAVLGVVPPLLALGLLHLLADPEASASPTPAG